MIYLRLSFHIVLFCISEVMALVDMNELSNYYLMLRYTPFLFKCFITVACIAAVQYLFFLYQYVLLCRYFFEKTHFHSFSL